MKNTKITELIIFLYFLWNVEEKSADLTIKKREESFFFFFIFLSSLSRSYVRFIGGAEGGYRKIVDVEVPLILEISLL